MKNKYLDVILDNDPILRAKNMEVELPLNKEDEELIMNMRKYVTDSIIEENQEKYGLKPAVGIAAPQVGVNKRMFVVRLEEVVDNDIIVKEYALVNPKIISHSEQMSFLKSGEGCLSVEDIHEGHVYRNARVTIQAYDAISKQDVTIRARGFLAIAMQHEYDHLEGILFYDRIDKDDPFKVLENAKEI
ncbi:MAG: peptide deformylase [Erysipelothrix sp.]|nr:peptide deformylase [Erysipelothrix sp.]